MYRQISRPLPHLLHVADELGDRLGPGWGRDLQPLPTPAIPNLEIGDPCPEGVRRIPFLGELGFLSVSAPAASKQRHSAFRSQMVGQFRSDHARTMRGKQRRDNLVCGHIRCRRD